MTQGLARVEELFEARNPKLVAEISDIDGIVDVEHSDSGLVVSVTAHNLEEEEYYFSSDFEVAVKEGQQIKAKQMVKAALRNRAVVVELLGDEAHPLALRVRNLHFRLVELSHARSD